MLCVQECEDGAKGAPDKTAKISLQENYNSKAGDEDRRVAWDQREKNNNNGGVCKNEAYDQEVLGCSFNQMVGTGTVEPTESLCEENFVQKGT